MDAQILQITDLHLFATADGELKGLRTQAAFQETWQQICAEIHSERWSPEWIVVTGDLAHDEKRETYLWLQEQLGDLFPRCRFLPGNHDNRPAMQELFSEGLAPLQDSIGFACDAGNWRVLGLDTHLPGELEGEVSNEQLAWLQAELQAHTAPTLIFQHHPSIRVESPWIDKIGLRNADELLEILHAHSQVKYVACGHVHQEFQCQEANLTFLTTPSLALQFKPRSTSIEFDPVAPGIRLFEFHGDHLTTQVVRFPRKSDFGRPS